MRKIKKLLQNRKIQLLIIALVTVFTYINILGNGFAWDDPYFFKEWPQIKYREGLPAYLSLPDLLAGDLPLDHRGVYRPVRSIYYLASYAIWGENPTGYHIQAIIVHLLITIIIYLITEIITKKKPLAFIVALLFGTHPIHTEAVTYTTASMDTLGILFFFLSFYLYLKSQIDKNKKNILIFASVIYATLAFYTYEMTLILPVLIVIYELCKNSFLLKKIIPKLRIFSYHFFSLGIYFVIRYVVLGIGNRADYLGLAWLVNANVARVGLLEIFAGYIHWLILPTQLSISHDVPHALLQKLIYILNELDPSGNLVSLSAHMSILFPIFYYLAGITIIYLGFRRSPLILFGLFWFFFSLLPVSNILPQGQAQSERFIYLPSFGFSLLSGYLIYQGYLKLEKIRKLRSYSQISLVFFIIITLFYSYNTIIRNEEWKDNKKIWQAANKTDPNVSLPYGALGAIYSEEGQYDKSIVFYSRGLKLDPTNVKLSSDLGLVYEKVGKVEKAITQYEETLKFNPKFFFAHVYLGNLYQTQGKFDLAEKEYENALEKHKNDVVILTYLGDAYFNQEKFDQALEVYSQVLAINGNSDLLNFKVGRIYFKLSKYDKAIESFSNSLNINPEEPKTYLALADTYKKKGDIQKAIAILKEGASTTNNQEIRNELNRMEENF